MTAHDSPVLVFGATGQQGGAAARALLGHGRGVRAFVRDPDAPRAASLQAAGATLAVGDLDDADSIRAAMDGVDGVFLVLTMLTGPKVTAEGVAAEERRGRLVADLAAEAGVGHLVYSSISGAGLVSGIPYYDSKVAVEKHIEAAGIPATVLRPVSFMENFTSLTRPVVTDGELVVSLAIAPETRMRMIAMRDIGEFAALAFERPAGRRFDIVGDILSGTEIAAAFGRAAGLPARFQQVPLDRIRAFDEQVARQFAWINERPDAEPDLSALRAEHPGLMTLETWLNTTEWKP